MYDSSLKFQLCGYNDASYVGDSTTRWSTSGFIFLIWNGIVVWCSLKLKSVALSITEAEYIMLSQAVHKLIWLMLLISNVLEKKDNTPINYYVCGWPKYHTCKKFRVSQTNQTHWYSLLLHSWEIEQGDVFIEVCVQ